MILNIVGWLLAGLVVGFVASKIVNLRGDDPKLGIGAAVAAAAVAGILHRIFAGAGDGGWNPWGLLFAALGAIVGAVIWHAVRSRSISHEHQTSRRSY